MRFSINQTTMKSHFIRSTFVAAAAAFVTHGTHLKDAIMQPASFGWQNPIPHGHGVERQLPGFANPANYGQQRQAIKPDLRTGDELKTKKQRNAEAAIKDPHLGIMPQF